MSILKIKDLVHKYVTYGDTEEDKQEIAAINHIDINMIDRCNLLFVFFCISISHIFVN